MPQIAMPTFDIKDIDQLIEIDAELTNLLNLRRQLLYTQATFTDLNIVMFLQSTGEKLIDLSTDIEGSPISAKDLMGAYRQLLDEKLQAVEAKMVLMGIGNQPHDPAPNAPRRGKIEQETPKAVDHAA